MTYTPTAPTAPIVVAHANTTSATSAVWPAAADPFARSQNAPSAAATERSAREQLEITRIDRQRNGRPGLDDPVRDPRRPHLQPTLAVAPRPYGVHDGGASAPPGQQFRHDFRRILQVRVHVNDSVATRC